MQLNQEVIAWSYINTSNSFSTGGRQIKCRCLVRFIGRENSWQPPMKVVFKEIFFQTRYFEDPLICQIEENLLANDPWGIPSFDVSIPQFVNGKSQLLSSPIKSVSIAFVVIPKEALKTQLTGLKICSLKAFWAVLRKY